MPGLRLAAACALGCAAVCGAVRLHREQQEVAQEALVQEAAQHRYFALRQAPPPSYYFNCSMYPDACKEPFNCQKGPKPKGKGLPSATADGHADFQTWCDAPGPYVAPVLACQKGNLREYGRIMHQAQKAFSPVVELIDAHYCFQHGHCDNDEIGPNTTLAEAEAICDKKFGHDRWTKIEYIAAGSFDIRVSLKGIYLSKKAEESFAMMACAMGNYHCDAIYCKQEYCSKSDFRVRYGEARPKAGKKAHGKHYPNNY